MAAAAVRLPFGEKAASSFGGAVLLALLLMLLLLLLLSVRVFPLARSWTSLLAQGDGLMCLAVFQTEVAAGQAVWTV